MSSTATDRSRPLSRPAGKVEWLASQTARRNNRPTGRAMGKIYFTWLPWLANPLDFAAGRDKPRAIDFRSLLRT